MDKEKVLEWLSGFQPEKINMERKEVKEELGTGFIDPRHPPVVWRATKTVDIKKVNGQDIFYIRNLPFAVERILGNVAQVNILNSDLSFSPCFLLRGVTGEFAFGKTIRDAEIELKIKERSSDALEAKFQAFLKEFPADKAVPGWDYVSWHGILTGSCSKGRMDYTQNHNIDLDALYTPKEFLELVLKAYGMDVLKQLYEYYK